MKKFRLFVSLFVCFCGLSATYARFVSPSYLPIDRLVVNTREFLKENPENDEAYFALARIYYLGFVNKSGLIPTYAGESFDRPLPYWRSGGALSYLRREAAKSKVLGNLGVDSELDLDKGKRPEFWKRVREREQTMIDANWEPIFEDSDLLMQYARDAFGLFEKAISIAPENGLYHLGLASLVEQASNYADDKGISCFDFSSISMAKEEYWKAYNLSIARDLALEQKPVGGLNSLVAYEAAESFLRLAKGSDVEVDIRRGRLMQESLDTFGKLKRGPITPIVFSLDGGFSLSELEDLNTEVFFDLDGDGAAKKWSWVQPTTGILVWDPEGFGRITSGRQLFGSVTWWVFFSNGFEALGLLDDDRDGELRGVEMDGLSVWFDINQNAVSEIGEVVTVQSAGVAAISTQGNEISEGVVFNRLGLELENGSRLPVYDWLSSPVD